MKRFKIISIVISFLLLLSTVVLASEPQVSIIGEGTAKPGETKTAVVSVSNADIEIGVVSGKIEKGSNITNISVSGKNGWNLTYNQATGVFNIYKSIGSKTEEIMNIEYTVSNEEGTAQIILRDIKTTTVDYETKNIGDITKTITIKNEVADPDDGEKPEEPKEEGKPEEPKEEGKKEDTKDKVTGSGNTTNKKDNTVSSDKKIPQTGGEFYSITIISILVLIAVVSYIGYKKYKIV